MDDDSWRHQNKTVSSRLKLALRRGIFADVDFRVQGQIFKCHKLVLALGSPYFERTFYHTFGRNTESSSIIISDVTPGAFQCVTNYLYTDQVTFGNEKQAFQTYEAAEKFQVPELKAECEIYLSELGFRPANIWNVLNQAVSLKMMKLQSKCMAYIQTNTKECLEHEEFLTSSEDTVMKIVTMEKMAISESELLAQITLWATKMAKLNCRILRVFMMPYLKHIRFKAISAREFCMLTKACPIIFSPEENLAILQYLELPYQNRLPSWCCTLARRPKP